jgi:hypothetical protein
MFQGKSMTKDEIQKIRMDIEADGQSVLSLMICRDGSVGRLGNGALPPHKASVMGMTDGSEFRQLMETIDERIFALLGIFDHPNKQGMPIKYSIAFLGDEPNFRVFEFRLGLENKDVGDLLPHFDGLIKQAVALTENWYEKARAESEAKQGAAKTQEPPKKSWWRVW